MTRLSNERLAEIKSRLGAATRGPWIGDKFAVNVNGDGHDAIADTYNCSDTAFIANSRTDIADLLNALEEAYKMLDK